MLIFVKEGLMGQDMFPGDNINPNFFFENTEITSTKSQINYNNLKINIINGFEI